MADSFYDQMYEIVSVLPNGQLYCRNREDGSFVILNDWRI